MYDWKMDENWDDTLGQPWPMALVICCQQLVAESGFAAVVRHTVAIVVIATK